MLVLVVCVRGVITCPCSWFVVVLCLWYARGLIVVCSWYVHVVCSWCVCGVLVVCVRARDVLCLFAAGVHDVLLLVQILSRF